jgi:hypothetical protein
MRILIAATAACLLIACSAEAKNMKACSVDWKAAKAGGARSSQTHKQFMTTCLAAGSPGGAPALVTTPMVHPAMTPQPVGNAAATAAKTASFPNTVTTGATAKCRDGSFSMSRHHSGSCSRHGGVAQFLQ